MQSITRFQAMKAAQQKISMVTCYDFWSAQLVAESAVDSNDSSIDLNGVLGSLTGKSGINFNDMMQKFDKGDSDGFGLDDAMDMLQGKGGLAGLGGLFGKK